MADNRKKRHLKVHKAHLTPEEKAKRKEENKKQKINFNDDSKSSRLEIVKGSRKRKKIARIITYSVIFAVVVTLLIINFVTPTGLVEAMQNSYALMGSDDLPVNIYSQNAHSKQSNKNALFLVNDSYFEVYNSNGKLMQAASHGMSNPRLKVSAARALVFDRDRYSVKIYNYSSEITNKEFDKNIFSASIGRNGTYAVAVGSDSYLGTVYVFNKNNKQIYSWNSANNYIADIAVADNGKSIAVCLVDAKNGSYTSSVYILNFNSATPKEKYEFSGLLTSLVTVNKNYILATGNNSAYSIPWKGGISTDLDISGTVRNYTVSSYGNSCIIYGRENNEGNNNVCILNTDGSVHADFSFSAPVTDISLNKKSLAVLSGNNVYTYNLSGAEKDKLITNINPLYIYLTSNSEIFTIDNIQLTKH